MKENINLKLADEAAKKYLIQHSIKETIEEMVRITFVSGALWAYQNPWIFEESSNVKQETVFGKF